MESLSLAGIPYFKQPGNNGYGPLHKGFGGLICAHFSGFLD